MRRNHPYAHLYAGTALGLCLAMHPTLLTAQTAISEEELQAFAPAVQPCIQTPDEVTCASVATLLSDCAEDIALDRCEVLLSDRDTLLSDSDAVERAQQILLAAEEELTFAGEAPEAELPPADVSEDPSDDVAADLVEPQADPDAAAEEAPDVEADPEPEVDADSLPNAAIEAEGDIEVEAEVAPETEVEADTGVEEDADLPATAAVPEEPVADDVSPAPDAPALPDADPEADSETDLSEEELGEAESDVAPEATMSEDAGAAEQTEREALEAELREEILREQEEERERLRAEADAMAQEAPELTVEDTPEEEFVAPADVAPEPDEAQRATIQRLMDDPEVAAAMALLGTALGMPLGAEGQAAIDEARASAADETDADVAEVIEEDITVDQLRTSREDFASPLSMAFEGAAAQPGTSRNRRDLERAGLAALGALAVGMVINQNRVVARSDERVVVDRGAGDLQLWRDDDAILMQDGSTRRIERYADGSTRSRWLREDGTEVITVRDATGRVLRRDRVLPDGTSFELIDDTREYSPIIVSELPPMRTRELRLSERTDPELAFIMLQEAEADARAVDRSFSLRQIRETRELRELLPLLSPDPITFETNRANVRPDEVSKLLQVGRLMERLIANDPREVFLIEGHTDATGPAAFNLALSDRRAESVALALTEFFEIPPENLVVQGYGERYLRIPTAASEERNRRVAIRRITPLITS